MIRFIASLLFLPIAVFGQQATRLFQEEQPLDLALQISFKEIKKKTNDSTYLSSILRFKSGDHWDSLKVGIRSRGMFRKNNCYFTPLRLKIKKEEAKGTVFEGNKSLKLVLPCEVSNDNNALIIKEYICYQLYELISPYTFNTRLVNIDLREQSSKKAKSFSLTGFFIEDDDLVAARHHAKVIENQSLHPLSLDDTSAIQHDLFQYMISNTDWSTAFYHNAKIIRMEPRKFVPLAYDFDMSGFVDAPYASVDPSFGVSSVRTRVYRGFCRKNEGALQYVRHQIINREPELLKTVALCQNHLTPAEYASLQQFMNEFFDTLKSDSQFRDNIVNKCRTK